jgi:hypothetical protein
MRSPEVPVDLSKFRRTRKNRFVTSVTRGKNQMPPWGGVLQPAEIGRFGRTSWRERMNPRNAILAALLVALGGRMAYAQEDQRRFRLIPFHRDDARAAQVRGRGDGGPKPRPPAARR